MLGLEHQYAAAILVRGPKAGSTKDGDVVRLGRAGGKDDLARFGTDGLRDLLPGCFNPVSGRQPALVFHRSRVAKAFCPQRLHNFCNFR